MSKGIPAALGGIKAFPEGLPFSRPTIPPYGTFEEDLKEIFASGVVTKGPWLAAYEKKISDHLGAEHCLGVSSCTLGLVLVVKALGLTGRVVMPSFTFFSTLHALVWNGVEPVFADCEDEFLTVDPGDVAGKLSDGVSAIIATNIFGNPPDLEALSALARSRGLPLIIDAAHAFGALVNGAPHGRWGAAEVFSTSATKLLVTAEGGVIATNDAALADELLRLREYGNLGNYDCRNPGLNARLTEMQALVGYRALDFLEGYALHRNRIAALYREGLGALPGLSFQTIRKGCRSSYKDFAVRIDAGRFGLTRDQIYRALELEGIGTRKYFVPPCHRQEYIVRRYGDLGKSLPVTERVCGEILCLPIFSHMDPGDAQTVVDRIHMIHEHRRALAAALR